MTARPVVPFGIGDVVTVAEQHYCYGLGTLTLRIVEVGRREEHSDGLWIRLRGVELRHPSGARQRRVLARLGAIRILPVPALGAHVPARPSWQCTGCGEPWPCRVRRDRLLGEYADDRAALGVYLGLQLVEALTDLSRQPAGDLHTRFLGWLRTR
ncbi:MULTISPECIES: hypothetical protein [Micromonospora]|uniref:PD-(D/E)XK nuclease superfamily protein n=1 Tax=Micromonospora humidisoli TaxID=2807622 RepID=A0ABS2JB64_9ACTN|nr:hypothetical protein [Micromonospora humidisoli]MBM7083320.1 hypothetical protein [Micromonospora humidisoli]